jgi:hypothetical protein
LCYPWIRGIENILVELYRNFNHIWVRSFIPPGPPVATPPSREHGRKTTFSIIAKETSALRQVQGIM